MPDGYMHYLITSSSYGLFYNNVEYFPGSEIAQWRHTTSADDRTMKFKYVGTVDGTEGEYFVSTGTTWVKKLFLFPTFIDKGSVGTTAQPGLPQATEENKNWCYKVATTKKYRIGQDKWITIDFKYMEYVAKSSEYESMSPVIDQHKNFFNSAEYTTIEYDCIQIRFTQTPTGYFKYSSTCWYNGKAHKDIYFNGHYHDALWLDKRAWNCDGYEWKKYLVDPKYTGHYMLANHEYYGDRVTYKGIGEIHDEPNHKVIRNNYRYYSSSSTPKYQLLQMHKMYDTYMGNIIIIPMLDISSSSNIRARVMVYYGVDGGMGLHRAISGYCQVGGSWCIVVSCSPGQVTLFCLNDERFYTLPLFRGGQFGTWSSWAKDASSPRPSLRGSLTGNVYGDAMYYPDGRSIGFSDGVTYKYDPSNRDSFDAFIPSPPDQEEVPIPLPQDTCLRALANSMFTDPGTFVPKGYNIECAPNERETFVANGNYYYLCTYTVTYTKHIYYGSDVEKTHAEALAEANEIKESIYDSYNPYSDYCTTVEIDDPSTRSEIEVLWRKSTHVFVGYNGIAPIAIDLYNLHNIPEYMQAQGDICTRYKQYHGDYDDCLVSAHTMTYYVGEMVYVYLTFVHSEIGGVRPCRDIYVLRMGNPEMEVIKTYANGSHLTIRHFNDNTQPDLTINFDGWLGHEESGFEPVIGSFGYWGMNYMINSSMSTFSVTPDPGDEWDYPANNNTRLMLRGGSQTIMSTSADMNSLNTTWYYTSAGA